MKEFLTEDHVRALLSGDTISERDFNTIVLQAIFEVMEHRKDLERLQSIIDKH